MLASVDWYATFAPTTPILEVVVRGVVTYLALFALLRLVLKRQSGVVSISDLLVLVLLADAAQNAMAGEYTSITDGLVLVSVIVGTAYILDLIAYKWPVLEGVVSPAPLLLVKDGRMLLENMRRELITRNELMSQLREQGVHRLEDVAEAHMEGTGMISVVKKEKEDEGNRKTNKRNV